MFRELLFLTLVHGTFGEPETKLEIKRNSDYFYLHLLHGDVEYISVDGVNISKAGEGSNCIAPNDCWQYIRPGRYLLVLGVLEGKHAAFTVHPLEAANRRSVGFQYKKTGTPEYPKLKDGVISVFAKELRENQPLLHILQFNTDIEGVEFVGSITNDTRGRSLLLIDKTRQPEEHFIFLTGHMGSKRRVLEIKFTSGNVDKIPITPYTGPNKPVMVSTFIDFRNAFKVK
ncbi:hypothetical protein SprV_0802472100 [Sparganum proliferum]